MVIITLHRSPRHDKKWMIEGEGNKVNFGQKG